jgi:hypothetical protein
MAERTSNIRLLNPRSPAREIQDQIRAMEGGIDQALADGGELIGKILRTGRIAGLHAVQVQRPIERVIASLTVGTQMRASIHGAHQDLRHLLKKIDLPELGWGDLGPSPDWPNDKVSDGDAAAR